jgi:hypothetical protein
VGEGVEAEEVDEGEVWEVVEEATAVLGGVDLSSPRKADSWGAKDR